MKKILVFSILTFFTSLAGLSAVAPQAVLQSLKGKVEVRAAGEKTWAPATEGEVLTLSATLSTGFDSSVVVVMGKSSIQVKPLTRMTLDKLLEQNGTVTTSTFLRVGSVSVSVKSAEGLKSDFKVQSPYSTASVRGTKFDYDGLRLKVTEGVVAFIPGRPKRDIQPLPAASNAATTAGPTASTAPGPTGTAPAPATGAAPSATTEAPPAPTAAETAPAPPADDFVGAPPASATPQAAIPVPAGANLQLQVGFQGAPAKTVNSTDVTTLQQKAAPPVNAPPPPAPKVVVPPPTSPKTTAPTPTTGGVTVTITFPS